MAGLVWRAATTRALAGAGAILLVGVMAWFALKARAEEQGAGPAVTIRPPDAFYDPPAQRPASPGALLRSEKLEAANLPSGMRGWRILYTTSVDDRTPAIAVAIVVAPVEAGEAPRPVLIWNHGTTGLLQKCMPSLASAPLSGAPALEGVAARGWVVVATDYSFAEKDGPHPYLMGEGEARAALDAVRAARRLPDLRLSPQAVVWGHSQGGHAALWTGKIAPAYAPEVTIAGVAAIAPMIAPAKVLPRDEFMNRWIGPYIARAYSRFYPDVAYEQALRPEARDAARKIALECGNWSREEEDRIEKLIDSYQGAALTIGADDPLDARLASNEAPQQIAAPVVVAVGSQEGPAMHSVIDDYVAQACAAGGRLDYWTLAGLDHKTIVTPDSPLDQPLIAWTSARFAGAPRVAGCDRKDF